MIPLTIVLAVVGAIFILAIFLTELEQFGWATLTLIATVALTQFTHTFDFVGYVAHHALESVLYTLGYLVVGLLWSFVKWFSFLMAFRDKYRECKNIYYQKYNLVPGQPLPESLAKEFEEWMQNTYCYAKYRGALLSRKPRASENKTRIVAWMAFWPCSLIGTLLNDPVRRLFSFLFNQFKALYQKMVDYVFKNDPELK